MAKSIGIPAYNEEKSIKKTISHILPQLDDSDEIIVVASGCTDNTINVVKSIKDDRIDIVIQKKREGKVAAINEILMKANNELIFLIDADVIIAKDSIKKLENNLSKENVGATCARVQSYRRETLFDKIQDAGWIGLNDQKIEENKKGTFWALNGYLVGTKKSIAPQIDKKFLLDDAPLGWLIKKKGYKIIYDQKAVSYVLAVQSFKDFIKQKSRNRIGWWQMTKEGMKISERRNIKQLKYLFKNPYAWLYIALDLVAWAKAWWDYKHQRTYWDKVESSKI